MKPISSISALALAAQTIWAVPAFAASPVMPAPMPLAGGLVQIDCHEEFSGESEGQSGYEIPSMPLGELPGVARLMKIDCGTSTPENKKTTVRETREVSRTIETVNDRCDEVPARLKIDCIAQRYEILAQSPDLTGEYSEVREALQSAAGKLRALANQTAAPGAPKERLKVDRNGKSMAVGRPLTPTNPAQQQAAFAAAVKIIEETETMLLRSAGSSKRRQVSYQRIAQAMDSNKVLLRS